LKPGGAQELLKKIYELVDLRRMPNGQPFNLIVGAQDREVRGVEFLAQDYLVRASATLGGWNVERQEMAHVIRRDVVRIKLNDLRQQMAARGAITPEQVVATERLFSSEIDLSSEISVNDEIDIVAAKKQFLDGRVVGGPMLAAKLLVANRAYYAFGFFGSDGIIRYYDADGQALPRPFLAAPLKYERISSTFDLARPDPVTGVVRPHQAIDYQAAEGTPVFAIGAGTVEFSGWREGYGFMVEIKHGGGYSSAYAHLSKIANGLQEGARINAGEPIGAVGRSGHATGPHLHFEFSLEGKKINFLAVKIAAEDSLTGAKLQEFQQERDRLLAQLRDGTNQIVGQITQPWN